MHSSHVEHRDIAKRQGLLGPKLGGDSSSSSASATASSSASVTDSSSASAAASSLASTSSSTDPLGSVIGGLTSALQPLGPSSTTITSVSLTSTSISSSSTASSSSVSTSTSSSSSSSSSSTTTSSSTPSSTSTSSTPVSTTPTSTSMPVSIASIGGTTVTATMAPSSSAAPSPVSGVSQSFLQNKPLSNGVFAVVGIIGAILLAIICTVWVRSARQRNLDREALDFDPGTHMRYTDIDDEREKRNNSTEALNLRRAQSGNSARTQNSGTHGSHHTGGGYPAPPMPVRTGDYPFNGHGTYTQTTGPFPAGQQGYEQGYVPQQGYEQGYASQQQQNGGVGRAPSRSPQPAYAPQTGTGFDSPNPVYFMDSQQNPIMPAAATVASQPMRRFSLINSPPPSPSAQSPSRRVSSKMPDPASTQMPVSPALPDHFGSDEDLADPYSGVATSSYEPTPHSLKVANK